MKTPVALLAFLLLVLACLFGVTRAATIEDNIAYQECLATPITCTALCLAPYRTWDFFGGRSGVPSEILLCGFGNPQPSEPLNLTGTIPTEIGRLTRLSILDIGGFNDLSGTIPTQIGRLTRLEHILLDKNDLEGTIPTEVSQLTMLSTFEVHDNHDLCGPIPYWAYEGNITRVNPFRDTIYPDVSEPLTNLGEVCPTAAPTTAAPTTAPTTAAPTTAPTTAAPTGAVVADQTQAPEGAASKAADTISKSGRVVLLAAAAGAAAANIVGIL